MTFYSSKVEGYSDRQGRMVILEDGSFYAVELGEDGSFIKLDLSEDGKAVALDPSNVIISYQKAKIVKIVAGMDFAMAVDTDGLLYTWGRNNMGQAGNGSVYSSGTVGQETYVTRPTVVDTLGDLHSDSAQNNVRIADIFTGTYTDNWGTTGSYAVAVSEKGDLFIWGDGNNDSVLRGETGITDTTAPTPVPVYVEMAGINDVRDRKSVV